MAGANAACANLDGFHRAVTDSLNLLQVRVPYAGGFVVGVAYVISEAGAFSAYFTNSGHGIILLVNLKQTFISKDPGDGNPFNIFFFGW